MSELVYIANVDVAIMINKHWPSSIGTEQKIVYASSPKEAEQKVRKYYSDINEKNILPFNQSYDVRYVNIIEPIL